MVSVSPYRSVYKKDLLRLFDLCSPQYFALEERDDFEYYLDHEIEDYFIIRDNAILCGCGGINYPDHNEYAILSWDIIHPDFQGKGLGRKLVNHRLDHVTQKSFSKLRVRTSQFACEFYGKFGFALNEVKKDYWSDGYDLYDMFLTLEP